jgi:hypothetical protein
MDKVEAYKASDGALFESERECQEHEVSLVWRARIGEFMDSDLFPYRGSGAMPGIAFKVIVAWEAFKASAPPLGDGPAPFDEGPEIEVPVVRKRRKQPP